MSGEAHTESIESIGIIGFGEVGQALARDLKAQKVTDIAAYDILWGDGREGPLLKDKAREIGVAISPDLAGLAAPGRLVMSAVTAGSAADVCEDMARVIRPGQLFLDLNSVSPEGKRRGAAVINAAGGRYVEAAIMNPIAPDGHRTPMLFGGPQAEIVADFLNALGMRIDLVSDEIGAASANKMCRSVMVKGMEALIVESMLAARHYGVEEAVLGSLDRTYPGFDWHEKARYMLNRVLVHGARRAEEMRFAAETVTDAGLTPLMAAATADRQQWVVDQFDRPTARALAEEDLATMLDAIRAELAAAKLS